MAKVASKGQDTQMRIDASGVNQEMVCIVGTAIVDKNEFIKGVDRSSDRQQTLKQKRKAVLFVEEWDYDG
jgi:hypothetical protein